MDDDVTRSEGRRSPAERALRGAARPFLGYFDRRFQDLHEHLDRQTNLEHLEAVMHGRFEHVLRELRDTRTDVASDTDTIAELAFTLERFADLFTARMEEVAAEIAAATPTSWHLDSSVVELPFAFAAAAELELGATAATVADDGRLSIGLSALGLQVTAVEPTASIAHADVAVVSERVDDWGGPAEPLDAVFALLAPAGSSTATRPTKERIDLFHKWLRPSGLLVLGAALGPGHDADADGAAGLLDDWDIERRALFELDASGAWRRSDDTSRAALVAVRATSRP